MPASKKAQMRAAGQRPADGASERDPEKKKPRANDPGSSKQA
jgi:hypothetical protein